MYQEIFFFQCKHSKYLYLTRYQSLNVPVQQSLDLERENKCSVSSQLVNKEHVDRRKEQSDGDEVISLMLLLHCPVTILGTKRPVNVTYPQKRNQVFSSFAREACAVWQGYVKL